MQTFQTTSHVQLQVRNDAVHL